MDDDTIEVDAAKLWEAGVETISGLPPIEAVTLDLRNEFGGVRLLISLDGTVAFGHPGAAPIDVELSNGLAAYDVPREYVVLFARRVLTMFDAA